MKFWLRDSKPRRPCPCKLLTSRGLEGSVPPDGWDLPPLLEVLSLGNNSISGTLPPAWQLPPALQQLFLWGNPIFGSIPPGWTLPDSLQMLELRATDLSGSLPETWTLPASLRALDISHTGLAGGISEAWASRLPQGLQELRLSQNQLTGLPRQWNLPRSLQRLDLHSNPVHSTLLADWGFPSGKGPSPLDTGFARLSLANASMSGTIPQWALPSNMQELLLQENDLTGEQQAHAHFIDP
jgi:Leucine-rich repeat (LRR) protein